MGLILHKYAKPIVYLCKKQVFTNIRGNKKATAYPAVAIDV